MQPVRHEVHVQLSSCLTVPFRYLEFVICTSVVRQMKGLSLKALAMLSKAGSVASGNETMKMVKLKMAVSQRTAWRSHRSLRPIFSSASNKIPFTSPPSSSFS